MCILLRKGTKGLGVRAVLGTLQYADDTLIINQMTGGPWESQPVKLSWWRMAAVWESPLHKCGAPSTLLLTNPLSVTPRHDHTMHSGVENTILFWFKSIWIKNGRVYGLPDSPKSPELRTPCCLLVGLTGRSKARCYCVQLFQRWECVHVNEMEGRWGEESGQQITDRHVGRDVSCAQK